MDVIQEFEAIAERVFERNFHATSGNEKAMNLTGEAAVLSNRLACINAKEHISVGEAAVLINCSNGHVRNLVGKARKRQTPQPIPFIDLDGVTVFNRLALLEWANKPKHKLKAIETKDKASNE